MEMVSEQLPNCALYSSFNVLNAEDDLFRIKKHSDLRWRAFIQYTVYLMEVKQTVSLPGSFESLVGDLQ